VKGGGGGGVGICKLSGQKLKTVKHEIHRIHKHF
jgi:hypothetical protein